jgi:chromosome segregation ATPase
MDSDINRSLGRLEGEFHQENQQLKDIKTSIEKNEEARERDRRELTASLDRLVVIVDRLDGEVKEIKPAVAELRANMREVMPVARQIVRWRTLGAGIIIAIVFVGSVFSEKVLGAKQKIIDFFFGG